MQLKVKILIVLSAGLLTLAADQATKVWARGALLGPGELQLTDDSGKKPYIQVIGSQPGVEFRLSYNKGSAFGLFSGTSGARVFLSIIGICALGLIFYLLKRPESDSKIFVYALGFVAGGAVGNLVDRIAFGQVTDFIWVWLTPSIRLVWPWPAFNIADIGLVVGVGLMIPAMLFQKAPPEAREAGSSKASEDVAGRKRVSGAGNGAEGSDADLEDEDGDEDDGGEDGGEDDGGEDGGEEDGSEAGDESKPSTRSTRTGSPRGASRKRSGQRKGGRKG